MSIEAIGKHITDKPNITAMEAAGYQFYFYGSEQVLPFATIATADNEHDQVSRLDRAGIFRVNIGIAKTTFQQLFPASESTWDYTLLNQLMPHPHYAAQYYVCVLNPQEKVLTQTLDLIDDAYLLARTRFERKHSAK